MRKRMKKIAMLLSAAMLINSMDGAVMVSATDMTEVIEESTGAAEESRKEEDSEELQADDEISVDETDPQDEEIILEEVAGETEDEEFIIGEQAKDILSDGIWDIQQGDQMDSAIETSATFDNGTLKCWIIGDYDRDKAESWGYAKFYVKVGEPLKLNIYAMTNSENSITYEWYRAESNQEDYDWKKIDGVDTNTYAKTMEAGDAGAYKCIVSDGKTALEKEFRVYATGYGLEYESDVSVIGSLFNNTILEAKATSDNGTISYKWFEGQDYDKNGKTLGTEQTLEIGPNKKVEYYQCYITDGKEEGWIDFTVWEAKKISIEAPEIVVVPKGEKATLTVSATAYESGEELDYGWGIFDQDDFGTAPGSNTFLTKNIDTFEYYVCEVSSESCGSNFVKIIVIADDLADKLPKDLNSAVLVPSNGSTKAVCINWHIPDNVVGKLIPDQSGVWKISENQSNPWMDDSTDMVIYDSEMKQIAKGSAHNNVSLGCYLEAGKVYYIGITNGFRGHDLYTLTSQYLGNGGTVDEWNTKEMKTLPTCTENGKRTVWSDELGMYVYDFPVPALGHISDEKWTVDREANCGEAGDRYRTCSRCGETYHETIPATGNHSYTTWTVERSATCTVDGIQSRSCTECGWKEEQVLAKTGHRFGDYVVTQEPTVLAEGVKTRTCSVCGQTENAAVSRLTGSISLTVSTQTLKNNGTTRLADIVTGLNRGDYIVSYVSTNPAVATVDSAGNVTGHAAGTANIIITTASGASATVKITVEQTKKVATTKLKASSVKLSAGQQKKLTVTVTPKNATDKVTYTSANKKIATVSADGTITGKKAGKTKITVKSGKKKVTVTVTVTKRVPTGITGIPTEKILKKGKTLTLKAKLVPTGAEAKVKYKSSNKKVATVSAKGKVKAKKAGTAVITITAGKVKTTCKITVK